VHAARQIAAMALVTLALAAGPTRAADADLRQGPEVAGAPRVRADDPDRLDPLRPMVRRIDTFFRSNEVDGVTMDSRYAINPSEAIRMGVVCQLLGYCEYLKVHPTPRVRDEIARHADYLVAHLADITSGSPFDGMLGYSFVTAYEVTGDDTHLAAAVQIVNELEAIPTYECILNGGLMVALDLAEYGRVTGDPAALQKAHDILAQLPAYQNADGSFPHWCGGSEDIHYTGWMAMELDLIGRAMPDPNIEPVLSRMHDWMEQRVDDEGHSHYEEPCAECPGGMRYFDSRRSGCSIDYDTRGWTVEPAYTALLFDRYHSLKYRPVMSVLASLETAGTWADKWDFIPTPDDPEYPWSIADTSVANTSIIFWALTSLESRRGGRDGGVLTDAAEDGGIVPGPARPVRGLAPPRSEWRWSETDRRLLAGVRPVPARPAGGESGRTARVPGGEATHGSAAPDGMPLALVAAADGSSGATTLRFVLARPALLDLAVYDVSGRRVRELARGAYPAGARLVTWDGRDTNGVRVASGIYFARLAAGSERVAARMLVRR
jgi:hypothetical protein